MRLVTREALESYGFDVLEAGNGREALALFVNQHPDLVLLDVMMPEMDGFAACAAIRNQPVGEYTPVLMMTGRDDVKSIHKSYEVGATDFITKPVNFVLLGYRLQYMLRSRRVLEELGTNEQRLETAQRIARLGNWEYEIQTGTLHLSREMVRIFDLPRQRDLNSYEDLLSRVHPEDLERVRDSIDGVTEQRASTGIEHRIVLDDGTERFIRQEIESADGPKGETWLVGTAQDVTERKNAEKKIHYLAYYDDTTGLPNRAFIREHLTHLIESAKRKRKLMAVLSLDLDFFERINDTLGRDAGDTLLKDVALRLSKCVRAADRVGTELHQKQTENAPLRNGDMVARPSGDEFIIVMTEIGRPEDAAKLAGRINNALAEPFEARDKRLALTASTGIAVYPRDGRDAEAVLKSADAAMHHAKEQGGNTYRFYSSAIHASAQERLALEASLRAAIERKELELYYQPKINMKTGRTVGMEALLRWRHPELGMIPPDKFIPLAEEIGLITSLGDWVLRTACLQHKAWQDIGIVSGERIAVNVSAQQFKARDFVKSVYETLVDTSLDPRYLEIEITEGTLMQNSEENQRALNELSALGVSIALDDFGTGYSSLSYLKRYPINTMKIDRSFVKDVTTDLDSAAIVDAIIALSRSVDTNLVAEGVETAEQYQHLQSKGCLEMQGYYISRPLPATEYASWLRSYQVPEHVLVRA
jgi:predicted signal transduction protein with EAL and GGDEF domain/DNA-binding response OmpR family regulator